MGKIIVVFSKQEIAINIRNLFVRNGIDVMGIAVTGAQAIHYTETLDEGIVVCGYKLQDMLYTELRDYLPDTFEMLLIASPNHFGEQDIKGIIGLPMPIKVYDLMNTVDMILRNMERRRKKRREQLKNRTPQQKRMIEEAKQLLMARNNMTEEEAHRYLQKNSMDSGTSMIETAQLVLSVMAE